MLNLAPIVFLLDVDNTLFDNDGFARDLRARLTQDVGVAGCERYWAIYEERRDALGYADYLGSLQQFRALDPNLPAPLQLSSFLLDYPFAEHLFNGALAAIAHLNTLGSVVILSDGDAVFQPRKVQQSGIWNAVAGRVLIYLHKQHALEDLQQRYPAAHYVMVDDKPQILSAMKQVLGPRLTTVFVQQGHYARAAIESGMVTRPDLTIAVIADLMQFRRDQFLPNPPGAAQQAG